MPTGLSPSMVPHIQRCSARVQICNLPRAPYHPENVPLNPLYTTDTAYDVYKVWADPRSLATTSGVAICFLFLRLLRCFNSPGWPRQPMNSAADRRGLPGGVAPFGDPRISLLAATRGLSQLCRVLHRLLVPRHPPHALTSLAKNPIPVVHRYRSKVISALLDSVLLFATTLIQLSKNKSDVLIRTIGLWSKASSGRRCCRRCL